MICRQLVKNYNKISQEKQTLSEKLKRIQFDQIQHGKNEEMIKTDIDRLQNNRAQLKDEIHDYVMKIERLTQSIQTKDKEVRSSSRDRQRELCFSKSIGFLFRFVV